jgi:hypothetical protein
MTRNVELYTISQIVLGEFYRCVMNPPPSLDLSCLTCNRQYESVGNERNTQHSVMGY